MDPPHLHPLQMAVLVQKSRKREDDDDDWPASKRAKLSSPTDQGCDRSSDASSLTETVARLDVERHFKSVIDGVEEALSTLGPIMDHVKHTAGKDYRGYSNREKAVPLADCYNQVMENSVKEVDLSLKHRVLEAQSGILFNR